jgi:hypothetical protein
MITKEHEEGESLIEEALERFKWAQEAYSEQRQQSREDLKFVAGAQWEAQPNTDELRLTVNLLNPFLRQITSDAREANPSINVIPAGDGADLDAAQIRSGLIRNIEQKSEAQVAYQTALWYAAAGGEGYIFLDSEYCSPDSFDQDLVIKSCNNPEKVFLDPTHEALDGCDSEWGFIIEDISHDAYLRQFPQSKLASKLISNFNELKLPGDWVNEYEVRLAKYWVKEYTTKMIYLVMDPITNETKVVDEKPNEEEFVILKKRKSEVVNVKCYLINSVEILDEMSWPGTLIPIVKVTGDSFYVGGKKIQHGAVRMAKDPQRQYNYFTSRQTEMIDLAPKNSFVGASGQFANNAEKWANANRVNYGFLDYTPVSLNGQPVPPPNRVSGLDLSSFQAVASSRSQSLEDLKLVFGLHDAALGRAGNEISGVAIQARDMQSRKSTYQYFDNLLLAMKCLGRQIVELIPFFYDTERTVRIVRADTTEQLIAINSMANNNRYDLSKGVYDVIVETGPAYASKREAALEGLTTIMTAVPAAGQVIGDLVAGQIDSPMAKMAAARIKATIPKDILAATGDVDMSEMAPAEQVQELQMQLGQMTKEMEMMQQQKDELEMRVKIAEDKSAMELTKADMEHSREIAKLKHQDEVAEIEARIKLKQLELEEKKLEIAEKQVGMKMRVDMPDISSEANIGGSLD